LEAIRRRFPGADSWVEGGFSYGERFEKFRGPRIHLEFRRTRGDPGAISLLRDRLVCGKSLPRRAVGGEGGANLGRGQEGERLPAD